MWRSEHGPVTGDCTVVTVSGEPATGRDYYETVTGALGVDPVWEDGPVWICQILDRRARSWSRPPAVGLSAALAELEEGLRR